jgi:hypothetical protein
VGKFGIYLSQTRISRIKTGQGSDVHEQPGQGQEGY